MNKYIITIIFDYNKTKAKKIAFEVLEVNNKLFFEYSNISLSLSSYFKEFLRLISLKINQSVFNKIIPCNDRINNLNIDYDIYMLIETF